MRNYNGDVIHYNNSLISKDYNSMKMTLNQIWKYVENDDNMKEEAHKKITEIDKYFHDLSIKKHEKTLFLSTASSFRPVLRGWEIITIDELEESFAFQADFDVSKTMKKLSKDFSLSQIQISNQTRQVKNENADN